MKPIKRNKDFENNFKKRLGSNPRLIAQFAHRLDLFIAGERSIPLNDHALSGKLKGLRAFSVSGDVRVIYEETKDAIIFLDIGTHNQVYK